jgi:hypothetical protein
MRNEFLKRLLESVDAIKSGIDRLHRDSEKKTNDTPTKVRAEIHFDEDTIKTAGIEQNRSYLNQRSIRNAAWATFIATLLAFITAAIYAGIAAHQASLMRKATTAAQKSADAAVKQLEVSERPWIQLDLALSEPLKFDQDGLHSLLKIVMKNTGNSAAASVLMTSEMHVKPGWPDVEMIQLREKLCDQLKQSVTNPFSGAVDVMFPGTYPVGEFRRLGVPKSDVENAAKLAGTTGLIPLILTCVVYRSTFNDTFHESAYSSYVGFFDPHKNNGIVMAIKIEPNMSINPDHLSLQTVFHGD